MASKLWRTPEPLATPVNDLRNQISGDVISAARLQAKRRGPKQIDGQVHSHDPQSQAARAIDAPGGLGRVTVIHLS